MAFSLLDLPARYRLILCDLWGCVHNGAHVFPGVTEVLSAWASQGRKVLFVTNAPRSAEATRAQLTRIGLDPAIGDGIVTAGSTGAAALLGRPVGFCGTAADRRDLERQGLVFADDRYDELACAGLEPIEMVADYAERLRLWRESDVLMHCLNPDRVVHHKGDVLVCAGALADAYEALGGRTRWYGKPYSAIYDHALALAGVTDKSAVLAIGDGLKTDIAGAAEFGIDAVFVSGGIHAGEEATFPPGWSPIATVAALGTTHPVGA